MKAFITKPTTRAIIIASLTTLIGWITSLLGIGIKRNLIFIFKKDCVFLYLLAHTYFSQVSMLKMMLIKDVRMRCYSIK